MVENQDKLTVKEFKAWLVGLIRGKGGKLPDFDDWKQIKIMLDKVEEEKVNITFPSDPQPQPWSQPWPNWPQPYVGDPMPGQAPQIWCRTAGETTDKITVQNGINVSSGSVQAYDPQSEQRDYFFGQNSKETPKLVALFDDWNI